MYGVSVHPRIWQRATITLRNRQAQQLRAVAAIEHAIELTQDLKRTTGFTSCDVLIAGLEQVLAELNTTSPMAPRSTASLNSLFARINLFRKFFAFLAQLAGVTGSLGNRAHSDTEPAEAKAALATAPLR